MKNCPCCQVEVPDYTGFCNCCGLPLNQSVPVLSISPANKLALTHERMGSFLPPWLWFWLIAYPIVQWQGLLQLWQDNMVQIQFPQTSDFLISVSPQFASLNSALSSFIQLLSLLALSLGIVSIFLPKMRAAYLERRHDLIDADIERPILKEISSFIKEYAPNIRVITNLLRGDKVAFIYPLGYRTTNLAIFGGLLKFGVRIGERLKPFCFMK